MENEMNYDESEKVTTSDGLYDDSAVPSDFSAQESQATNGETLEYHTDQPQPQGDNEGLMANQMHVHHSPLDMVSVGHVDETSGLQGEVEEEKMEEDYGMAQEGENREAGTEAEPRDDVVKVDGENFGEVPAAVAVQEVVREIIPDIPDDEYFESLDPEEIDCYKKVEFTFDTNLHCTTCFRQVTYEIGGMTGIVRHPILGVVVCKQCKVYYVDNDWTKDDDGCDMFCRWCAEGGELILCDNCTSSFCRRCLQRNMGRDYITEITSSDTWKCLRCNPKQLDNLRALYYQILVNQAELKDRPLTNVKSEAIQRIEREMEEMPENFIDDSLVKAFYALKEYEKIMEDERARWVIANRELELEVATGITRRLRKIYAITKQKMDQLDKDLVTSFVHSFPLESTRIHMGEIEPVLESDDEDLAPLSAPKNRKLATIPRRKSALKKLAFKRKSNSVKKYSTSPSSASLSPTSAAKKKPLKVPVAKYSQMVVVNGRAVTPDPLESYGTPKLTSILGEDTDSDAEIITAPPPLKKRKTGKF